MINRLMRMSVSAAAKTQPRRIEREVDKYLYASPAAKADVEEISRAAAMLRLAGFAPGDLGSIAVRRTDTSATITTPGSDLRSIDNRHLTSIAIDKSDHPVLAGLQAGAMAAAIGYPPNLLALASSGIATLPLGRSALGEMATEVTFVGSSPSSEQWWTDAIATHAGVVVSLQGTALSIGSNPIEAAARMEAAEALAIRAILVAGQENKYDPS